MAVLFRFVTCCQAEFVRESYFFPHPSQKVITFGYMGFLFFSFHFDMMLKPKGEKNSFHVFVEREKKKRVSFHCLWKVPSAAVRKSVKGCQCVANTTQSGCVCCGDELSSAPWKSFIYLFFRQVGPCFGECICLSTTFLSPICHHRCEISWKSNALGALVRKLCGEWSYFCHTHSVTLAT